MNNSLQTLQDLGRYSLIAVDGEIGRLKALVFDDTSWAIRYILVGSGDWLDGRSVLVSPIAVGDISQHSRTLCIELTREQIANAPQPALDNPLSRQYEKAFYRYYNWPPYWEHDPLDSLAPGFEASVDGPAARKNFQGGAGNGLCSTQHVLGYKIAANSHIVGQLEHIIVDTQYWLIRYLGINAETSRLDKAVLVNRSWIRGLNRAQGIVNVDMNPDALHDAPDFDPSKPVSRDYETELFNYHGRRPYWA